MKEKAPNYLINLIPKCEPTIRTRNNSVPTFNCWTDCFKYSFFPSTRNDWFNLNLDIRNAKSVSLFKSNVKSVCDNFESMPDNEKKDLLLFGDSRFDENKNENILETTISYIKKSRRFSGSLFD